MELRAQGTKFDDALTIVGDATQQPHEPLEVRIYYIPNLSYRNILSVYVKDKMVLTAESGGVFQDLPNQKAFFVEMDSLLFKEAVYKKFPCGAFAKIETKAGGLGNSDRRAGPLWQAPAFNAKDLVEYFGSFGCKVTLEKLKIEEV